ncbi:MAG TPA: FliM/FliN family flagellar motor switch protein [Bryobacteraceae bacterium]|jgi:flagellar motor switch protein FliN/FliY|nr:FliM/FliN family flagellar motor switch protein [Bryobacteraceae bacterium]
MTNNALVQAVEGWLKELTNLLGTAADQVSRGPSVPCRAKGEGKPLVWWRPVSGSAATAAEVVWIGAAADDIAVICPGNETGENDGEFSSLLNRASGIDGELTADYPRAQEYETFHIPTPAIGEVEIVVALVRPQPEAVPGVGALMDVELPLTLRFGSTHMPLHALAGLSVGSVIEFDGALSDPVELMVNGRVIARGEAVVLQGCYALRISEIASRQERLFSADFKSSPQSELASVN